MGRVRGADGRAAVLKAAQNLFYAQGVEAVSVDHVAQAAGVTKRAVYYHFPSKRDLVIAYLEHADDPALELLQTFARDRKESGSHPFALIIDGLGRWMRSGNFHGCAFLSAAKAMPDDPSVVGITVAHKRRTRDWLAELAASRGDRDPAAAAGQFLLVLDAVLSTGHLYPVDDLLGRARAALAAVLATQEPQTGEATR